MIVQYADPNPDGLATMVGGLIEQNLERDPSRLRLLRPSVVTIDATDADVVITLRLSRGRVEIERGAAPDAHVRIHAESEALLEMTAAPLRFGLPDPFSSGGRATLGSLVTRRTRVRGMLAHPRRLARLTALLSAR